MDDDDDEDCFELHESTDEETFELQWLVLPFLNLRLFSLIARGLNNPTRLIEVCNITKNHSNSDNKNKHQAKLVIPLISTMSEAKQVK